MESFIEPPRARRRRVLENIRRRARIKAERDYAENIQDSIRFPTFRVELDIQRIYKRLMKSEGHWMYGGCSGGRKRCSLCSRPNPLHHDRKQRDAFECEAEAW